MALGKFAGIELIGIANNAESRSSLCKYLAGDHLVPGLKMDGTDACK